MSHISQYFREFVNVPLTSSEVLSFGPIAVFRAKRGCTSSSSPTVSASPVPSSPNVAVNAPGSSSSSAAQNKTIDYEILHGWTPLLMSTAKCFTSLMCNSNESVYAPLIWKLGASVSLFTHSAKPDIVEMMETEICYQSKCNTETMPIDSVTATIFMADMRKFGDVVEMRVTSNMTIYNDEIYTIVLKNGAKLNINHFLRTS